MTALPSQDLAVKFFDKTVAEKLKKGYAAVRAGGEEASDDVTADSSAKKFRHPSLPVALVYDSDLQKWIGSAVKLPTSNPTGARGPVSIAIKTAAAAEGPSAADAERLASLLKDSGRLFAAVAQNLFECMTGERESGMWWGDASEVEEIMSKAPKKPADIAKQLKLFEIRVFEGEGAVFAFKADFEEEHDVGAEISSTGELIECTYDEHF